ncbi:hypothetical protein CTEN210_13696 [Chaetoceros tenuissimus]|uniref:Leucine-rich repeat domain-containing protein n=1 Tax=Chaetoceros tenuissimus TaxID=426638 RepID=A0AAD3D646_9STRA|nr:hypothetical protein CTEN210_13696 [Chaetoceros tenuissimus]
MFQDKSSFSNVVIGFEHDNKYRICFGKISTEEWNEIVNKGQGVHLYKGKRTYFYNGGLPTISVQESCKIELIIILPGVEIIPRNTFVDFKIRKTVILSDTVRRIEEWAFADCCTLAYIKLSRNLEFIGEFAFHCCKSLTSIFIPPSCIEIGRWAFFHCEELIIFHVPQHTQLGRFVIGLTALFEASPFEPEEHGNQEYHDEVNAWIKNINNNQDYELHRACASFNPDQNVLLAIVQQQDLSLFKKTNEIGITPARYLSENPFANIDQQEIIKTDIFDKMGEIFL